MHVTSRSGRFVGQWCHTTPRVDSPSTPAPFGLEQASDERGRGSNRRRLDASQSGPLGGPAEAGGTPVQHFQRYAPQVANPPLAGAYGGGMLHRVIHGTTPAAAHRTAPRGLQPMLAVAAQRPPADESAWAFELKFDGARALYRATGGSGTIRSRTGRDLTG